MKTEDRSKKAALKMLEVSKKLNSNAKIMEFQNNDRRFIHFFENLINNDPISVIELMINCIDERI